MAIAEPLRAVDPVATEAIRTRIAAPYDEARIAARFTVHRRRG